MILERPELELEKTDYGCERLALRTAEVRLELGEFNSIDLRGRLIPLLRLEANERLFLGEFSGHRLVEGLSSHSHRTLYCWIDGDQLGFVVQSKNLAFIAQGTLGAQERTRWHKTLVGAEPEQV